MRGNNIRKYLHLKRCWFKVLSTQHFINKAVKLVRAILDYIEACLEIVRNSSVMFFAIMPVNR